MTARVYGEEDSRARQPGVGRDDEVGAGGETVAGRGELKRTAGEATSRRQRICRETRRDAAGRSEMTVTRQATAGTRRATAR